MPRDNERYRYVTAAIVRNSTLEDFLLADSADSGKSLADLIVLRLMDYYRDNTPQARTPAPAPRPAPRPAATAPATPRTAAQPTRQATATSARAASAAPAPARKETAPAPVGSAPTSQPDEEIKEYDPKRSKNAAAALLANMDAFDEE